MRERWNKIGNLQAVTSQLCHQPPYSLRWFFSSLVRNFSVAHESCSRSVPFPNFLKGGGCAQQPGLCSGISHPRGFSSGPGQHRQIPAPIHALLPAPRRELRPGRGRHRPPLRQTQTINTQRRDAETAAQQVPARPAKARQGPARPRRGNAATGAEGTRGQGWGHAAPSRPRFPGGPSEPVPQGPPPSQTLPCPLTPRRVPSQPPNPRTCRAALPRGRTRTAPRAAALPHRGPQYAPRGRRAPTAPARRSRPALLPLKGAAPASPARGRDRAGRAGEGEGTAHVPGGIVRVLSYFKILF